MMQQLRRLFLFTAAILGIFVFLVIVVQVYPYVLAQDDSTSTNSEDIEELQKKIEKYEKKLSEIRTREQTLASEIEYMDSQINLTQLRIQNSMAKIAKTVAQINKLSTDIEDLQSRIFRLEGSIAYQNTVLHARLRERYKSKEASPLLVIFGSETMSELLKKAEYLQILEIQDHKLLTEMASTKDTFNKQKGIFEDTKADQESLKKQLEQEKQNLDQYKTQLVNQNGEKKQLLAITQNDEAKYKAMLADAQRELNQIVGAVSVLKNQAARDVKKGEVIGIQGNTGRSSGDHLHFGVYRYSSFSEIDGWNWYYSNYLDPSKKLKSKSVYWDTGCETAGTKTVGKGDWSWPMASPTISQGYGHTCWSNVYYGGKDHPAYDMYGPSGSPIFAVDSGKAYFCRNCLGDGANGVFIFHDDDYMTIYWHLR